MSVVRTCIAQRECVPFVDTSHHIYPLASGSGSVQYFLSRSWNVAYVGIRVGMDFKKYILQGVWVHLQFSPPIALPLAHCYAKSLGGCRLHRPLLPHPNG
jgi:hypothetical protein